MSHFQAVQGGLLSHWVRKRTFAACGQILRFGPLREGGDQGAGTRGVEPDVALDRIPDHFQ